MSGFYWIASYPKSGNTWIRLMLARLVKGTTHTDFSQPINFAPAIATHTDLDRFLDVESSDLTSSEKAELRHDMCMIMARETSEPLFRKVHDSWGHTPSARPLFPPQITLGSVHVVRDPRDVAISWAHHSGLTLDQSIAFMANEETVLSNTKRWKDQFEQKLGSWSSHVTSWLAAEPAPLLVTYESLSADTATILAQVAAHCGISASESQIADTVAETRFDRLQQAENLHTLDLGQQKGRKFFRRGIAGGWQDTLSASQAERIVQDHHAVMTRLGYL
jgi:aryl sulfotransferase